ncbi:MAG: hypothetical protein HUJ54_10115 [Erysipelotrichaceae bacterium]|nr:hypothetical protein [Erysipelotrichaceae bacterium]
MKNKLSKPSAALTAALLMGFGAAVPAFAEERDLETKSSVSDQSAVHGEFSGVHFYNFTGFDSVSFFSSTETAAQFSPKTINIYYGFDNYGIPYIDEGRADDVQCLYEVDPEHVQPGSYYVLRDRKVEWRGYYIKKTPVFTVLRIDNVYETRITMYGETIKTALYTNMETGETGEIALLGVHLFPIPDQTSHPSSNEQK